MVLLAPTVTALQTLLEVYRAYAGPHDIVYLDTWSGFDAAKTAPCMAKSGTPPLL